MNKINGLIGKIGGNLQSLTLLLIRLAWGFQLYESGWGHLTNLSKTVGFFTSLHIPCPTVAAYISGGTELAGGVLLIVGLFSRLVAVPLLFNFCMAYLTASRDSIRELIHFKNPDDFINDAAFPFLVTSLLILAFGPGKIALDSLFGKKSASAS